MCIGLAGRVTALTPGSDLAQVEVAGVPRNINIGLLDDRPAVGDYLLIHTGFALEVLTEEQAADTLAVFGEGSFTGRPDWSTW